MRGVSKGTVTDVEEKEEGEKSNKGKEPKLEGEGRSMKSTKKGYLLFLWR